MVIRHRVDDASCLLVYERLQFLVCLQQQHHSVSSGKAPYNNTSLIDLEICPLRAAVERLAGASAQSPADTSQSTDAVSVDHASEVLWKTPSVLKFQGYEHNQLDENGDHEAQHVGSAP